jgi:hypothetical protein
MSVLYWEVIHPMFQNAYEEPKDFDAISRIYAYSDWCHLQDHTGLVDGTHLPTEVLLSFYEWIPTIAPALLDMPNWFAFTEIEGWINTSFMRDSRPAILRAFDKYPS